MDVEAENFDNEEDLEECDRQRWRTWTGPTFRPQTFSESRHPKSVMANILAATKKWTLWTKWLAIPVDDDDEEENDDDENGTTIDLENIAHYKAFGCPFCAYRTLFQREAFKLLWSLATKAIVDDKEEQVETHQMKRESRRRRTRVPVLHVRDQVKSLSAVRAHMEKEHDEQKPFMCSQCNKQFAPRRAAPCTSGRCTSSGFNCSLCDSRPPRSSPCTPTGRPSTRGSWARATAPSSGSASTAPRYHVQGVAGHHGERAL